MASYDKAFESYKKALTTAASVAASLMLVRSVVNEVVPYELREMLFSGFGYLRSHMSSEHTIIVEKKNDGFTNNHIYNAVRTYLATRINTDLQQRLRVSSMDENDKMMVTMAEGEEMLDVYEGTEFKWCLICNENSSDSGNGNGGQNEVSFEVSFHKEKALKSYLPFILATAKAIKAQERTLRIYMTEYSCEWSPIDLHHPSTFDTLAMDQKLKQSIIDDLNRFIKRKDYYKKIGKAWKRGYLLYGPPGTGKSSLIAAMANLLREEGEGREKSNSTEENKGEDKVTLSGLLNFVDGLWSTSGEERIIVFTTNYKERLDPALLRPGRMDMHIHMGYCTQESFRILANNYHAIDYHDTYPEIEKLIKEVTMTPAEVAEILMRNDDADIALHDLVDFLKSKMIEANEIKTEQEEANNQLDEKKDNRDSDKK
nr:unnamed protein product [Digitaria exilis]